jgi:hypothetical protein
VKIEIEVEDIEESDLLSAFILARQAIALMLYPAPEERDWYCHVMRTLGDKYLESLKNKCPNPHVVVHKEYLLGDYEPI